MTILQTPASREGAVHLEVPEEDIQSQNHRFFPKHRDEKTFRVKATMFTYDPELAPAVILNSGMFQCNLCGEYPSLEVDQTDPANLTLIAGESMCATPDGFTYDVTVDVPSGELVFADFFTFVEEEPEFIDINHKAGQKEYAEWLEERNVGYTQLSSGGYEIHRNLTSGEIFIGELYDEDVDDEVIPDGHELLGDISCGVWSVCFTDSNTYSTLMNPREEDDIVRVSVPSGRYTLTNYTTLADHEVDVSKPTVHAVIKKADNS